jgi:dihydroneopterin aldolase
MNGVPVLPRGYRVVLEDLELEVDIGFHDFEIGAPQRLTVTIDVAVEPCRLPRADAVASAWNYDLLRTRIHALVAGRRFNLQETLAAEIFDFVAALPGVVGLRVETRKTDIYPDARAVGVILTSG